MVSLKELFTLESKIKKILIKNPITRDDDQLLFIAYWRETAPNISFLAFYANPEKYGGKKVCSVERCRRKIQENNPELKDKNYVDSRYEQTTAYIQFAIGG
jgi:hypothetical protein